MSVLKGFLQPSPMGTTKEVIISDRFKGEDGKPLPFKIQVIDQDTNNKLIRMSTKQKMQKGNMVSELDQDEYGKRLVVECTVEPNFRDTEMCNYYGVADPLLVPGKMLSAGEHGNLIEKINEINGFVEVDKIKDEAKN